MQYLDKKWRDGDAAAINCSEARRDSGHCATSGFVPLQPFKPS